MLTPREDGKAGILISPMNKGVIATALHILLAQPQESRETLVVYRELVSIPQGLLG